MTARFVKNSFIDFWKTTWFHESEYFSRRFGHEMVIVVDEAFLSYADYVYFFGSSNCTLHHHKE